LIYDLFIMEGRLGAIGKLVDQIRPGHQRTRREPRMVSHIYHEAGHLDTAAKKGSGEIRAVPARFQTDSAPTASLRNPSSHRIIEIGDLFKAAAPTLER
jgi:hypothetical protein